MAIVSPLHLSGFLLWFVYDHAIDAMVIQLSALAQVCLCQSSQECIFIQQQQQQQNQEEQKQKTKRTRKTKTKNKKNKNKKKKNKRKNNVLLILGLRVTCCAVSKRSQAEMSNILKLLKITTSLNAPTSIIKAAWTSQSVSKLKCDTRVSKQIQTWHSSHQTI